MSRSTRVKQEHKKEKTEKNRLKRQDLIKNIQKKTFDI